MKKSQRIIMVMSLALLAGSLIVMGCPMDTETEYVTTSRVISFDTVVSDLAGLTTALANSGSVNIMVKGNISLSAALTIPEAKHVYLYAGVNTNNRALTVEGSVVIADTGSLTASSSGVVKVTGEGNITVEKGAVLSIDNPDSVNNGAESPETVLGSNKVVISGGQLAYASSFTFNSIADIEAALGYMESGTLEITGIGFMPSEITGISGISSTKRLSIDLDNTAEIETVLTIPAELTITTLASLSGVTATVYGGLTAPEIGDLVIKSGATVNGVTFPGDTTGTVTSSGTAITIEGMTLGGVMNIPNGVTVIVTGAISFAGMSDASIAGGGMIKTEGEGILNIGPHGGFTTISSGVTGDGLMTAATGIIMELAGTKVLTDKVALDIGLFGGTEEEPVMAIGSVEIAAVNTAKTIQNTGNATTGTNLSLAGPSAGVSFNAAVTSSTVSDNDIVGTYTLTLLQQGPMSKVVQIADGGFTGATDKYGVVTFTDVQLQYGNLISNYKLTFKVGIKTKRS